MTQLIEPKLRPGYAVKIVRDDLADIDNGDVWYEPFDWDQIMGRTARTTLLRTKLCEEIAEYLISLDPRELLDISDIVDRLAEIHDYDLDEARDRDHRGGFKRMVVMFVKSERR